MKRVEIIKKYRSRIAKGLHNKLKMHEQEFLIQSFVDDLMKLKTEVEIKARCYEEIMLLEEGYPVGTVAKTRLNRYRIAVQDAVDKGQLKLTATNSKQYEYEKRKGIDKTGEFEPAHHHFGWLYMSYDNETYISLNRESAQS